MNETAYANATQQQDIATAPPKLRLLDQMRAVIRVMTYYNPKAAEIADRIG